jgi:hypothetical protein
MKARNRVTIEHLEWNLEKGTVSCRLKSDIDQSITLIQRQGIETVSANVPVRPSAVGNEARTVHLKAGKTAKITLRLAGIRQ